MLEFIMVPAIVGICVAGTYALFELFARRRERLNIIEKIGDKLDPSLIGGKLTYHNPFPGFSFDALKTGCLLTGLGLGLLVGFLINLSIATYSTLGEDWLFRHDTAATVYGASVLFFGGIGLLTAFVVQLEMSKKKTP
ncbi:MAG: hypothetical protein LBI58_06150 [Tannerellaceae bacterium]|jgi:hypothetical protein|nr:hypothetical protein [Tannerellaceae bacterium]